MTTPELKLADNGIYYIHWSVGRRSKRLSTRQTDERKAQIFMANWMLAANAPVDKAASTLLVGDLWDIYCRRHKVVSEFSRVAVWKNLGPFFTHLTPAQITYAAVGDWPNREDPALARSYVAQRASGKIGGGQGGGVPGASSTIRHELVLLRAALNWCAHPKQNLISKTDVPNFDLPPETDPRDRWLRSEEIQPLLTAAATKRRQGRLSRVERFLWIALETAARKTAILELTWDRVDFETNVINFDVPGRVKTKKRRAQVPISKSLHPILLRAYKERVGNQVLDNKSEVWREVRNVASAACIADVTPNVLRHTAATHMARRGVSLWIIAGILKNSMKMVEKVYAKHSPEGLASGIEKISGGVLELAE